MDNALGASEKISMKQKAYQIIKKKILYCEYPPNSDLNEAMLLEDTGCGHTPIKDALSRLEQEKLLSIKSKKGIRVSNITLKDLSDTFEMRRLLEPYAILSYGPKLDKEKLQRFEEDFRLMITPENVQKAEDKNTFHELYDLDDTFHSYLVQCGDNMLMHSMMEIIADYNTRLRVLSSVKREGLLMSYQEHTEIIKCLLDDRYEAAAEAMKTHLEVSRTRALEALLNGKGKLLI